jgi:hypothetical protein
MFGFIVILFMTPSGHSWIINKIMITLCLIYIKSDLYSIGNWTSTLLAIACSLLAIRKIETTLVHIF